MDFRTGSKLIQAEVAEALSRVEESEVEALISAILSAKRVFVIGAGRVGLAARAFAMRLMHLGLSAWFVGDVTTPAIGLGDLLLVCSGSGETVSVHVVAELAAQHGAEVATITRQPGARVGQIAKTVVRLMAPEEDGQIPAQSTQPMTTLFEQSLFLFLDAVVLLLMERLGQTGPMMWQRHMNLE